jgi:hypothetical protein
MITVVPLKRLGSPTRVKGAREAPSGRRARAAAVRGSFEQRGHHGRPEGGCGRTAPGPRAKTRPSGCGELPCHGPSPPPASGRARPGLADGDRHAGPGSLPGPPTSRRAGNRGPAGVAGHEGRRGRGRVRGRGRRGEGRRSGSRCRVRPAGRARRSLPMSAASSRSLVRSSTRSPTLNTVSTRPASSFVSVPLVPLPAAPAPSPPSPAYAARSVWGTRTQRSCREAATGGAEGARHGRRRRASGRRQASTQRC